MAENIMSIDERLKSRAFRDRLREHPVVKAKAERAKSDLIAIKMIEQLKAEDNS